MKHVLILIALSATAYAKPGPACALLTLDELKSATGKTLVTVTDTETMCIYQLAPGDPSVQVLASTTLLKDDSSEDAAKTGTKDAFKMLNKTPAFTELKGLGDWAFSATTTSGHGRLIIAHKGHWRVQLSLEAIPDPGTDKLDTQAFSLVKTALAKLKK